VLRNPSWYDRLAADHANLMTSAERALDRGMVECAAQLVSTFNCLWSVRGYPAEGFALALRLADKASDSELTGHPRALAPIEHYFLRERDWEGMEEIEQRVLRIARVSDDEVRIAGSLSMLVVVAMSAGRDGAEVQRRIEEAMRFAEQAGTEAKATVLM